MRRRLPRYGSLSLSLALMKGNDEMRLPRFSADAALYQTRQHYKGQLRRDQVGANYAWAAAVHAAAKILPFPTDYAACLNYCDDECVDQCTYLDWGGYLSLDVPCYVACDDRCRADCEP